MKKKCRTRKYCPIGPLLPPSSVKQELTLLWLAISNNININYLLYYTHTVRFQETQQIKVGPFPAIKRNKRNLLFFSVPCEMACQLSCVCLTMRFLSVAAISYCVFFGTTVVYILNAGRCQAAIEWEKCISINSIRSSAPQYLNINTIALLWHWWETCEWLLTCLVPTFRARNILDQVWKLYIWGL